LVTNYANTMSKNDYVRRDFLKSFGMGAALITVPFKLSPQDGKISLAAGENGLINILDFGAKGDGSTDNTAAIQKAVDAAARTGATILIPAGTFLTSTLKMHPHVGMLGYPTWSYRDFGGSILRLNDRNAKCLIDITGAYGSVISGLCLDGAGLGIDIHGVLVDKPDYGNQEDTPLIERCRISHFSGDAVRLSRIWCFRVRSCMLSHCGGNGLYVRGWDGFIMDNWFSGNKGIGFAALEENASNTLTGNRIEWNQGGGIVIRGGDNYNITGNYIDRSGGPAICLLNDTTDIAITGNMIYRSGKPEWTAADDNASAHVRIENCSGIVFTGNSLRAGRDDDRKGMYSPSNGIVYKSLKNCILKDNVLNNGSLNNLLLDGGGHGDNVIVKDNIGSLLVVK
jgi:hypothetical protein